MRNIKIDILRVVFALIILLHHLAIDEYATMGYLAVEFFFFVSGYMLISQFSNEQNPVSHFLKKTLPILLATQIIFILFEVVYYTHSPIESFNIFFYSVLDAFGLSMSGLPAYRLSGSIWYISAYIIATSALFVLTRHIGKKNIISIAPIIAILSIGYLYWQYSGTVSIWWVPEYKYCLLLRAIGDMCFGITIYSVVNWIKEVKFTDFGKSILTLVEIGSISSAIVLMIVGLPAGVSEFLVVALLFIATTITFSEKTYLPSAIKKNNDKIARNCAYLSLMIYLCHDYWAYIIDDLLPNQTEIMTSSTVVMLTALTIIASMIVARLIVRFCKMMIVKEKCA